MPALAIPVDNSSIIIFQEMCRQVICRPTLTNLELIRTYLNAAKAQYIMPLPALSKIENRAVRARVQNITLQTLGLPSSIKAEQKSFTDKLNYFCMGISSSRLSNLKVMFVTLTDLLLNIPEDVLEHFPTEENLYSQIFDSFISLKEFTLSDENEKLDAAKEGFNAAYGSFLAIQNECPHLSAFQWTRKTNEALRVMHNAVSQTDELLPLLLTNCTDCENSAEKLALFARSLLNSITFYTSKISQSKKHIFKNITTKQTEVLDEFSLLLKLLSPAKASILGYLKILEHGDEELDILFKECSHEIDNFVKELNAWIHKIQDTFDQDKEMRIFLRDLAFSFRESIITFFDYFWEMHLNYLCSPTSLTGNIIAVEF